MAQISGGSSLLKPEQVLSQVDIRDGMTVADLGCGRLGFFVLPLAKLIGPKGTLFVVDILKNALKSVETRAKMAGIVNIKTIWSDLEKYGATAIASESCDVAVLVNVLFQVKERANVIKESARLLKPGGQLLVVDWKLIHSPFGPPNELRAKTQDIIKMAKDIGLSLTKEFDAGEYHFGLIFKK